MAKKTSNLAQKMNVYNFLAWSLLPNKELAKLPHFQGVFGGKLVRGHQSHCSIDTMGIVVQEQNDYAAVNSTALRSPWISML